MPPNTFRKLLVNSLPVLVLIGIIICACWWASRSVTKTLRSKETPTNLTDAVTVTVYYETYCPDCVTFVLKQLYPVHAFLREKLVIDFVPFGKAEESQVDGKRRFDCQHGPRECEGNTLHACAVREACGEWPPQDCPWNQRSRLVEFVYCNLEQDDHVGSAQECTKKAGLDADEIMNCASSSDGSKLLSHYGNRTATFRPAIGRHTGFVPYIAIDGIPNKEAWTNLLGEIYKQRPELC